MTENERRSRDSERTQPDGLAARSAETTASEETAVENAALEAESGRKPFNPWVRGIHAISAEHRRELMAMELPKTPAERLFQLGQATDAKASAPPAVTVDSPADQGAGADESRRADTLRLRRPVPQAHPIRRAALGAAASSIVVASILWFVFGGSPPPPSNPASIPTKNPAPPSAPALATEPLIPVVAPSGRPSTEQPPLEPTAAPKKSKTRQKAEGGSRAAAPPDSARSPSSAPAAVLPNTPPKPSSAASDDDASPFGKWTAPPRN